MLKREEVAADWRNSYEGLRDMYSWPSIVRLTISRRMRLAEHVARMAENSRAYRVVVGKRECGSPLRRLFVVHL